jgi:hypothetical protein
MCVVCCRRPNCSGTGTIHQKHQAPAAFQREGSEVLLRAPLTAAHSPRVMARGMMVDGSKGGGASIGVDQAGIPTRAGQRLTKSIFPRRQKKGIMRFIAFDQCRPSGHIPIAEDQKTTLASVEPKAHPAVQVQSLIAVSPCCHRSSHSPLRLGRSRRLVTPRHYPSSHRR